ncbi:MAG: RNA polymerase sigma factor RpoD/SigA [Gemmatimonadetes bacterium]|nr:RNA polymerase sigma factor RpoD/SigA [Gemmatimonadota bacterium]
MKSASVKRRKPVPTAAKAKAKANSKAASKPKAKPAKPAKAVLKAVLKAKPAAKAKPAHAAVPVKPTKAAKLTSAAKTALTVPAAATLAAAQRTPQASVSVASEPKARKRRRAAPSGIAPSEPERDILDQYLYEVSTYPLLKGHEEIDIARKIRAGDADALQELVKRNLRFVISVAKKYQNRGLPLIDLIGEGNVGLLTAARKFDPDQGVKFISYAVWWIRQAILSSLARQGRTVRVPLNRTADLSRIIKASEILRQKLRREPTPEELAQLTGLSVDVVQSLAALNTGDVRLDAPMDPDGDRSLIERFVADEMPDTEEEAMNRFLNDEIESALNTLPPRDAKVLRLYFGLEGGREHTLEEIGSMLGVTRERVRQLRDRALKRLREGEVGRALGSFAG